MSETQKFLNVEGIKVLWNQINLKDYPNNETLVAVLNAIDETKADKSYVDEQIENFIVETWSFTLEDGSVITKEVVVK